MGADAAKTDQLAAWRSQSLDRLRHECARDRARSLHSVLGREFDLQAALAAIEEHACLAERGLQVELAPQDAMKAAGAIARALVA